MIIHVLLADDHPVVREGLRNLLAMEPDFNVVGEAGNGIEVVQLTERLKPDVLIVDLMMPGLNGLEVTRQVSERIPSVKVILLSMHSNESYVMQALKNGARGYVIKDSGPAELIEAVRQVVSGRRFLSPTISEKVLEKLIELAQEPADPLEDLTSREREVVQLAAEGYTSAEIGNMLSLSARTVEQHRANLMNKLGLHNQTELVLWALRRGIITIDS